MSLGRGVVMLLAISAVALCLIATGTEAQLQYGFYSYSCPRAEDIVKEAFNDALSKDKGIGADLLRLHFHDCFVRGCDGSVLLDSANGNKAEKDAEINQTIEDEAFEVIDNAKTKLEAVCKGVVSCADILAFVARDSVAHYGGVYYQVPAGRRDGTISRASDSTSQLPTANLVLSQLTQNFASRGLSQDDLITLSGAHTIGVAHCPSFTDRLYPTVDPTLDPSFAAQLEQKCPANTSGADTEQDMDPASPLVFDTSYYNNILYHRGLFTSDQTLLSTPASAAKVRLFASNSALFQNKFAAAMVKMGNIGVLTGSNGQIRSSCRAVN